MTSRGGQPRHVFLFAPPQFSLFLSSLFQANNDSDSNNTSSGTMFCCCRPRKKKPVATRADPPPAYYSDFNFYAEQMRDRQLHTLDDEDDDDDDDDDDEALRESTELLRSQRSSNQGETVHAHWLSCFGRRDRCVSSCYSDLS